MGSGATPLAAVAIVSTILNNPIGLFDFNQCYLPITGGTGGIEIVYDFKHQERGIFYYSGPAFNGLTMVNLISGVGYVGKTRGFATNLYRDGVKAYGGYFAGLSVSIGDVFDKGYPANVV